MRDLILKHALKNELEHGKANPKAVVGRVLGEDASLRGKAQEVIKETEKVVKEIANWSEEEKRAKLAELWPDAFEKKIIERERLKPLPGMEQGKIVMRFAPNPNGPPTLGSARGIIINGEYCRKYNGKYICRFDDTDPSTKVPMLKAYDWYLEDMDWLGYAPHKVVKASERIEKYYEPVEELIAKRAVYVCVCSQEEIKKQRATGKACHCRDRAQAENLKMWRDMLAGKYDEGEAVLRVKTDMQHPDPAIRDWVAFRILKASHPLVGNKYTVWPMLDFEGAIEDKLQGVTHIIRGKDLRDSTERQKYLYNYMGWTYPDTYYWGRIGIHEFGKLSTSGLSKAIAAGEYTGWDDPRIPTVRALRRRGFKPEAVREFWLDFGLSEKDAKASMANLESINRKLIDAEANRFYFVPNPKKIMVKGIPDTHVRLKNHPENPERGQREYHFNGEQAFFIPADAPDEFRLKGAFNVKRKGKEYVFDGAEVRDNPKLQWVSDPLECTLLMNTGPNLVGVCERELGNQHVNTLVQLERVGYARVERTGLLVFTHG
jgi:glutamyl-tRNA synthetase